jgi:hypothetical protein
MKPGTKNETNWWCFFYIFAHSAEEGRMKNGNRRGKRWTGGQVDEWAGGQVTFRGLGFFLWKFQA